MEYWRLSLIGFDFDRSIFAFILAWCWTVFSYKFNTFNRLWCPHFSGSASSNKTKLKQWSYHFLWVRSLFQVHGKVLDFFELLVFFSRFRMQITSCITTINYRFSFAYNVAAKKDRILWSISWLFVLHFSLNVGVHLSSTKFNMKCT